jgi:oligopeptidase B
MAMKRMLTTFLYFVALTGPAAAQLEPTAAQPPVAKKVPKATVLHGEERIDHYYWLREKSNPQVMAYLEAENAYTAAVMKPTEAFQEVLYKEILGRIKQTDLTVPYQQGSWWYYNRTEEGKQYAVHARKRGSLDANEEVLLDLNELAKGQKFLGLGAFQVSDDAGLLAYSIDTTGFREYTLHVKDLWTGKNLADEIPKVQNVVWTPDNKTFFYVAEDHAKRPYRLMRHVLGQPKDEMLYEEKDERFRVRVSRSRDKAYYFLTVASSTTTEVRTLPANDPAGTWRLLLPREEGHEYTVDHRNGLYYLRTNKDAKNFRLVVAPVDDPRPKNWVTLVSHRPDTLFEGVDLFAHHAVFHERHAGLQKLRVLDFRTGQTSDVVFPEPVYSVLPANNPEFDVPVYRYQYVSLTTPLSVYDYDLDKKTQTLKKRTEILGGYDPAQYVSERLTATASDGTKVPISLVYKKGVKKDGTAPLLLYGYGSYGSSLAITFAPARLSLLDRGVIYAMAHVRGGKEMGETWYDQGKMLNKKNTFTDFIACADHLVAEKYTAHDRLAIEGGSAGGLLIGAVLNLRPDLCKAAVLHVPFVDVINTMLDETLPLTVPEFLEWGNPKVKAEYDYLKTYCPYSNLAAKDYPAMLVRTSLNDSQVMYWEPAKYVAKLRTLRTDKNPLLFKVNMAAGHGGASGRYDALKETAFTYAFLLNELGIPK